MALIHKSGDTVIRYATLDDFKDVMNINDNVHAGTDYLAELYKGYFSDVKSKAYILEMKGMVVGFGIHSVVDGGKTDLAQAGRIKAQYFGQGDFHKFGKICVSDMKYHFPSIEDVLSSTWVDPHQYNRIYKMATRSEIVHFESIITLQTRGELQCNLSALTSQQKKSGCENRIRQLDGSELQQVMQENKKVLGKYIMLNYQPYKITDSNIKYFVYDLKVVGFASQSVNGIMGNTPQYIGMSFYTAVATKVGLVVFMNYKGRGLEDFEVHLKSHLQYLYQRMLHEKQGFHMYLCFQSHIPYGQVLDMAFNLGLRPGIRDIGAAVVLRGNVFQDLIGNLSKAANL